MCVGVPAQVVSISEGADHEALVEVSGARRIIDVSLVVADGLAQGDWVLVHVGFAMAKIDEAEAQRTLELMRILGGDGSDDELTAYLESTRSFEP